MPSQPQMRPERMIDAERGSEMAKHASRSLPEMAEMAQDGPKMAPRRPKIAQERAKRGPYRAKMGPRWAKDRPRWPQTEFKIVEDETKAGKIRLNRRNSKHNNAPAENVCFCMARR